MSEHLVDDPELSELAVPVLDSEVAEAINKLPRRVREPLMAWLDEMAAGLEQGSSLTPADAAFRAVEVAVARERIRMARELHDGLAADLATAVALFKYYFEGGEAGKDSTETLRNIYEILERTLENTRHTLRTMRPRRLGPSGLVDELRATAEEYGKTYGIRVELWTSGTEQELTDGQREVVYHIVREALTNARRHSGSPIVRVRLAFAAKPFMVEVTDEGKGFSASTSGGYGLVGMRERAAGIGGRLEVVSTQGRGTTVFLFGPEPPGLPA